MTRTKMVTIVAMLGMLLAGTAAGQDASKSQAREREMLRRAQAAQKQAEEQSATLSQEKARIAAELDTVKDATSKAEAAASRERKRGLELQRSLDGAKAEREKLEAERNTLQTRVADLDTQLRKVKEELAAARASLAEGGQSLERTRSDLAGERRELATCVEKNAALAAIADDLLDRYRKVGVWEALRRREPFTGERRVEVDNLIEDARDRVAASRVSPPR
jgi:chromosome segregation ATPase